jgi:D-sedoheptulose 7-phosphate isomerase
MERSTDLSQTVDFEKLEQLFSSLQASQQWRRASRWFSEARTILFLGNGGSFATAAHGATDVMRLTTKAAFAPDPGTFLTALSNDLGYHEAFAAWIKYMLDRSAPPSSSLVIAFSASGRSANVIEALRSAGKLGARSIFITGQRPSVEATESLLPVFTKTSFYHSFEVLSLMTIYGLIEDAGFHCPSIPTATPREFESEQV